MSKKTVKDGEEKYLMFINKTSSGRNNICGQNVANYRKSLGISQRELADRLQLLGMDIDKNAIQRIESGQRFVTDIEIIFLTKALNKNYAELLNPNTFEI